MKSKDKVLKIKPTAISHKIHIAGNLANWHIIIDGVCYGAQRNESWAWAEALRILKDEN